MRKITTRAALIYTILTSLTFLVLYELTVRFSQKWYYWPACLGVYFLSALVFIFWIDYQTKLIVKLSEMAKTFSEGRITPIPFLANDDEIGELSESMQIMAENLNKNLQETLEERDRIETILASMAEGVLAFDGAGKLILMNKTAAEMLKVTWEEVANRYFLEILRNHNLSDLLKAGLTDTKRQVMEVKLAPTSPEFYRVYITPIISKESGIHGVVMVLRNITKMRLLEQMRSEFVSNVSHELRTPLTSIKGYVETLLDGALENEELSLKFLKIINNEADRLNRLISDLLYLSSLETGRMEVAKKTFATPQFIEKVVNIIQPVAEKKNVVIETYIHSQTKEIYGNQGMLEQVLINLLDNAVKYSPAREKVKLEIGVHEQGVYLKVSDNGIGIPAESLPRLFERFYRVDKARSRQVGGTGLGLSIVKHIVERHRGQIQVESEEQEGTTFTVILPNV